MQFVNDPARAGMMRTMPLDPPVPLTSGSRSGNSRRTRNDAGPVGATLMPCTDPRDQRWDAITRYRECVCLQDCRNEERILQNWRTWQPAFHRPQQRKLHGIQDYLKIVQLVDEGHATLFQGPVHHGIARGTGKEDHAVL